MRNLKTFSLDRGIQRVATPATTMPFGLPSLVFFSIETLMPQCSLELNLENSTYLTWLNIDRTS